MRAITITDRIKDERVTVDSAEAAGAIRGWFPDAPEDVTAVLDELQQKLRRHEPTEDEEAYLAIEIS